MQPIEKLTRARGVMILHSPFYATLALGLAFVEKPEIETMATDGESIFFNPEFVKEMSDAETRGVIAHEVLHVANLHHTRRGNRDPEDWNRACDYAINPGLIAEGFSLPAGVLNSAEFEGMSAEQIYKELRKNSGKDQGQPQAAPQGQQGAAGQDAQGQPGNTPPAAPQGQQGAQPGQGQQGQPGTPQNAPQGSPAGLGVGGILDAAPVADPAAMQAAEMQAKARVMQAEAAAKARGQQSEAGKRAADQIRKAEIDWREVLRRYVDSTAKTEFAWSRPNRRFLHSGMYLPGKAKDSLGKLSVVIDTSGSIDKKALGRFMSELQSAVSDVAPETVEIIQCDFIVRDHLEFQQGETLEFDLKGGKITDMQPALDLIGDCAACVVFTDCDYPRELREPAFPVLFVKWGTCRKPNPKFGETIEI